jgi:PIN domain nuclease of toxin-antitoxin system
MFPTALKSIRTAAKAGELFLSPVSAWEIGVLVRRGRLSFGVPPDVYVARAFGRPGVRIAALSPQIAVRSSSLPGSFPADPADRMLVSTAMLLGLKLVTRDSRILAYGSQGHISVLPC